MSEKDKPRNLWEKLDQIPRQVFYTLLIGLMVFALVVPLGLPVRIGTSTGRFYDRIEKLPKDSVVLFDLSYGPDMAAEFSPQAVAVMYQLFSRPIKILFISMWQQGPMIFMELIDQINPAKSGKAYGTDWMYYGYRAGGAVAIAELARDLFFFKTDYKEQPLTALPVMKGLKDYKDITMLISVASSATDNSSGTELWVMQWASPYKVPMLAIIFKMMIPRFMPYVQAGQIQEYLGGIDAAAEYELIIKRPGKGTSYSDALTYLHLLVIALIVLGNIGYLARKQERRLQK